MKITLNALEMAAVRQRMSEFKNKTDQDASIEFITIMLSSMFGDELDEKLDQVFDLKKRMLQEKILTGKDKLSCKNK